MQYNRIRLANTVFSFESSIPLQFGGKLDRFQTTDENTDVFISVRYAEPGEETPDYHGYAKICCEGSRYDVALGREWFPQPSLWLILAILPLSSLLLERGTLSLHASYILHRGEAILFSGPSGIGKSTQAELWCKYRGASLINGDRVLLTPGMDGATVGSHFLSGTSGICNNVSAPVKAIILLDQAEQNRILASSPLTVFQRLISQLDYDVQDRHQIAAVTALVEKLMAQIKVCKYACRMDESAVLDLEKYLYEEYNYKDHCQR